MKKNTKLQVAKEKAPVGGEVREHRTGPVKEKTQITVRIDKQLMAEVYAQIKEDNSRITDIIEQGLMLALRQLRHEMPAWTKQVRFVLANATQEQVRIIRGLAIAMVENEVEKRSPDAEAIFDLCMWFLKSRNSLAHGGKCLELYSRYGKSADDIAKLG